VRLRAALFVNLVEMRHAISKRANPPVHLSDANLLKYQQATYLFHSAHSCSSVLIIWFFISVLNTLCCSHFGCAVSHFSCVEVRRVWMY